MPWAPVSLVVGAYLAGSVPFAYLLARWRRGIDPRAIGSGNVGASNLRNSVGLWATVLVGVVDIAKGAVPVWLGSRLGMSESVVLLAGLAAVIGHDWSVWLGFQGGRGGATTMGVYLAVFPFATGWILACLGVGALFNWVAPFHALGVLTVPLWCTALGEPTSTSRLAVALALLMLVKRLEANNRFAAPAGRRRQIWLARLTLDRDSPQT